MSFHALIDHTLLKPDATRPQIEKLCAEAREHSFFSVCLNPYWIPDARRFLNGSPVKVCTVVGFPLGANLPQAKAHETRDVIRAGADEVDMVMNIAAALENHWNFVEHEVHEVVSAAAGATVKVILETALLSTDQILRACRAVEHGGAHFVKTSTGFGPGGATVDSVRLMRRTVSPHLGVKASGGIKDAATARAMVEAGATRLGTSSGVAIVNSTPATASY